MTGKETLTRKETLTGKETLTRKETLTKKETLARIETLRENLHLLIVQYGIGSKEVLTCSEELDKLIYYLKNHHKYTKTST